MGSCGRVGGSSLMPVTANNIVAFKAHVRSLITAGHAGAAAEGAELYQGDLSENTHPEYPDGPFSDANTSSPGEFPYRRTGQAADRNVWFEVSRDGRAAAFGVYRDGLHVIYLSEGQGRLGPIDTYRNNRDLIAGAWRANAR